MFNNQGLLWLITISFIIVIFMFDIGLILYGEIRCKLPIGVKGLVEAWDLSTLSEENGMGSSSFSLLRYLRWRMLSHALVSFATELPLCNASQVR